MNGLVETENEPETLFDLSALEVQVKLPNENKILFIPLKPVHHKALKLQNLINTMEVQAAKNGAQFNSRNYLDALNSFTECAEEIRKEIERGSDLVTGVMAAVGNEGTAGADSEIKPISMGFGVPAKNSLAG